MEIIKANLKWNGNLQTLYLTSVKYIVLHHTAHPTWGLKDVHNYHQKSNGWIGIGYNYFIEKDGTIYEARGLHVGAGATGYNRNSLHICFAGNFETQTPTDAQINAGKWLVDYLLNIVPYGVKVIGHKDLGNTSCPGKNFPLAEFKKMKREEKEMRYNKIEEMPEYAKVTIQKLVDKGVIKGNEKGLDLSEDMIRMYVSHDRLGIYGE